MKQDALLLGNTTSKILLFPTKESLVRYSGSSVELPPPVKDITRSLREDDQSLVVRFRDGVVKLELEFPHQGRHDRSQLQIRELQKNSIQHLFPKEKIKRKGKRTCSPIHLCLPAPNG